MSKPLVHYSDMAGLAVIGRSAFVHVAEHTTGLKGWIHTSRVEKVIDTRPNGPVFETLNTIYTPAVTDETFPVPTYKEAKA